MKYVINEPVWDTGTVSVATWRKGQIIGISYRDKYGNRLFPKEIKLTPYRCKKYPVKKFNWGKAYIIPVEEFR